MQRRDFIKNSALCAVAVSTSGFIRFDGIRYVGDCETTTDILGPYYRPDSPVRNNLVIKGDPGEPITLSGFIKHNDCISPYKNAKIELWHCDGNGAYDNESDKYSYRGTSYSDDKGAYTFHTILPVPYSAGEGYTRPAHFHLMITAAGYQPLVTQLYFSGDKNIQKDPSASSPLAKRRLLEIQTLTDGTKKVSFDISMAQMLPADPVAIDKLTGIYTDKNDKSKKKEFFKKDQVLWMKNEVFGESFLYTGKNTFVYPGMPAGMSETLHFELMAFHAVQLTHEYVDDKSVKHQSVYLKEK